MGTFLSRPRTAKESLDGGDLTGPGIRFGLSSMQGWRHYMEDAHLAELNLSFEEIPEAKSIFAVFDGHGGPAVSAWAAETFTSVFRLELNAVAAVSPANSKLVPPPRLEIVLVCEALQRTFMKLDEIMRSERSRSRLKELHSIAEVRKAKLDQSEICENGSKFSSPNSYLQNLFGFESEDRKPIQSINSLYPDVVCPNGEDRDVLSSENEQPDEVQSDEEDECITKIAKEEDYNNREEQDSSSKLMHPYQPECCGATAVAAVVLGGSQPTVVVANAGDSRALVCREKSAVPLSFDHKPTHRVECERIVSAGGQVVNGRVDGNLNLSRCLGDLFYKMSNDLPADKQKIIAYPDIRFLSVTPADKFLLLACDGIWDCLTNQQAVDFVLERRYPEDPSIAPKSLSVICEEMCDACMSPGPKETANEGSGCSFDNMTVIIVELGDQLLLEGSKNHSISSSVQYYGNEEEAKAAADSEAIYNQCSVFDRGGDEEG